MNPLKSKGQGPGSTRHSMITSENASGGTEAHKPKHSTLTLAFKNDLLNVKRSAIESDDFNVDTLVESPVSTTKSAANDLIPVDYLDAEPGIPITPVVPASRYTLLTDDDLRKLPQVAWRIKNVLPSHGLAVVFGPSGSGKSFLVLDIMQSLALGSDWFGHRVKPCSVTYIALEGEAGLAGRVNAYRIYHGSSSSNIVYMAQSFGLLNADDINDLVRAIKTAGTGDVVVIDTLSRATPGSDENDSKAMGSIVAAAKLLQEALGGLVLLIHHTGKDASKGMRGHSLLHAALDCAIEVKRNGDNREWVVAKSKDGEDGSSHAFKLEVVHLGTDSDGDAITSCVIVANQSAQATVKKMPTLGKNQTIALKALQDSLPETSEIDKDGPSQGKSCLPFDQALAIVTTLMPTEAKYKKQRAKEAITGLVEKNILEMKEEWIWAI